jgi:hypothetical protein
MVKIHARRRSRPATTLGWAALMTVVCWLTACAPKMDHYVQLDQYMASQDYDAALTLMTASKETYTERNAALYYLDEGLLAHYAGRYEESIQSLLKAEAILDELYTHSISNEAAAFITNDNTLPYRGEDFEDAMVHLFLAIDYICIGLKDDALVEARQVDSQLNLINSGYEEDERNVYKEDGFIRFLMGVLYETNGEVNDAFISYRKAEEIYRNDYRPNYGLGPTDYLIASLMSSADALGFEAELNHYRQIYPGVSYPLPEQKRRMAEVFVVHYNGPAPEKTENQWLVPMPDGYIAKIPFPQFVDRSFTIKSSAVRLTNRTTGTTYRFSTERMEDIGAIAKTNLDNRLGRIKAKAVARATTKYLATKAAAKSAEDRSGGLAGMLVQIAGNVAAFASESADVRQWRMLPDEIRVGAVLVPPGEYEGTIDFVGDNGATIAARPIKPFTVAEGTKTFFIQRTLK